MADDCSLPPFTHCHLSKDKRLQGLGQPAGHQGHQEGLQLRVRLEPGLPAEDRRGGGGEPGHGEEGQAGEEGKDQDQQEGQMRPHVRL